VRELTPTRWLGARLLIAEWIAGLVGRFSLERRGGWPVLCGERGRLTALRFKKDFPPSASKSTEHDCEACQGKDYGV
jgi:hypothetical protein